MNLVMGISDRVYVLNFGSRIAAGTPAEVQRDPAVIVGPATQGQKLTPELIAARPGWAKIRAVQDDMARHRGDSARVAGRPWRSRRRESSAVRKTLGRASQGGRPTVGSSPRRGV